MFPCSEALSDNPMCVSELQFCDGVADCPAGSDEPVDCQSGKCAKKRSRTKYYVHMFLRVLCARRGATSEW